MSNCNCHGGTTCCRYRTSVTPTPQHTDAGEDRVNNALDMVNALVEYAFEHGVRQTGMSPTSELTEAIQKNILTKVKFLLSEARHPNPHYEDQIASNNTLERMIREVDKL